MHICALRRPSQHNHARLIGHHADFPNTAFTIPDEETNAGSLDSKPDATLEN
jgi:hypothetical protein